MSVKTISIRADKELINAINNLKWKKTNIYVLPDTTRIIKRAILFIDEFIDLNIFENYVNFYYGSVDKNSMKFYDYEFIKSKKNKVTTFDRRNTDQERITPAEVTQDISSIREDL